MKYITILSSLFLICSLHANAQHDTVYYFLSKSGQYLGRKDSADIIRKVINPKQGEHLYTVHDYYPNGIDKLVAHATMSDGSIFQGYCIEYFPNGKKKSDEFYKDDIIGPITAYYPNGKLYISGNFNSQGLLIVNQCRDSSGNILATDGKGDCIEYTDDFSKIVNKGQIEKGIKKGMWKHYDDKHFKYSLIYQNGIAHTGIGYDSLGKEHFFTQLEEQATYKGGMPALFKFLNNRVHLTESAKQSNIAGSVIVTFIIEKDGSITNVKITKSLGNGLDEQAVAIIRQTSKLWQPARQYGIPVRTLFNVPVSFYEKAVYNIPVSPKPTRPVGYDFSGFTPP